MAGLGSCIAALDPGTKAGSGPFSPLGPKTVLGPDCPLLNRGLWSLLLSGCRTSDVILDESGPLLAYRAPWKQRSTTSSITTTIIDITRVWATSHPPMSISAGPKPSSNEESRSKPKRSTNAACCIARTRHKLKPQRARPLRSRSALRVPYYLTTDKTRVGGGGFRPIRTRLSLPANA
jgi:hypothetical protein